MKKGMCLSEIKRLIEWLKTKGMTAEEIVECFEYISTKQNKKG